MDGNGTESGRSLDKVETLSIADGLFIVPPSIVGVPLHVSKSSWEPARVSEPMVLPAPKTTL